MLQSGCFCETRGDDVWREKCLLLKQFEQGLAAKNQVALAATN
jgi:hypothetical protein